MDGKMNGSKRKAIDEAAEIACPRVVRCKMIQSCIYLPYHTQSAPPPSWNSVEEQACFESLPREIFYNVLAYLGPTSPSLCHLSQLTHEYNSIMISLGDVMLHRALLQCRTPLVARSYESSISLFVRYARVSKAVHDKLEVLEDALKKEFPSTTDFAALNEDCHKVPMDFLTLKATYQIDGGTLEVLQPSEIVNALNIALCLLRCSVHHYFSNVNDPNDITMKHAAKTALERRVSNLCCKIGAKAYNYAKSRMLRRQERDDHMFSVFDTAVTYGVHADEDESDYDEDDDNVSIDPSEQEADDDMIILDKACLVMQCVVLRQQRNAT